jgi:hypothetical protein
MFDLVSGFFDGVLALALPVAIVGAMIAFVRGLRKGLKGEK